MNQESKNLWMAILFAVIAAGLLYSHIQEKNKSISKKFGAKATVVVAKVKIDSMIPINETHLDVKEVPIDFISPGAIKDPNEVVGLVSLTPFREGEQILQNKITKPSPLTGLSLQVSPGKRAVTIPIDDMRGVAKLLKPGDRIDLIAALEYGEGQSRKRVVRTIMQNVPILAAGVKIANELPVLYKKNTKGDQVILKNLTRNTDFNHITIEASPLEAQNIIFILNRNPNDLSIVLRHPTDTGPIPVNISTDENSILGLRRVKRKAASAAPPKRFR